MSNSQALSLKSLVEAAVLAPSPDNNQPWRFVERQGRLELYLDPSRALPSDVNSMFDLIGLGAAIENMCLAAREQGFEPTVEPTVDLKPDAPVASIAFSPGGTPDPLVTRLASRCTCRKMYSRRPVPAESLDRMAAAGQFPNVQLDWISDRRRIRAFAGVITKSDRLRFEYEPFHEEIFRQFRFTAEEAERTRDGLDLRTLELPPGAGLFLRWLRPWRRMQMLQRFGLGRLLTVPSAVTVLRSGTLGLMTVPEPTTRQFLDTGRAVQRLWLAADAEQIAFQPLGSLSIFIAQLQQYEGRKLNARHQRQSRQLIDRLAQLVPETAARTCVLLFRLGYASPTPVRSLRRSAADVFESNPES
ncbi:MAG: hypothetical protein JW818_03445 [Pirellulales bacterium]|nr:hypothetical protein [Pirellulales bacterium]